MGADFTSLKCGGEGLFEQARFNDAVAFTDASFEGALVCNGATFAGGADFTSLKCKRLGCTNSNFDDTALFVALDCNGDASFEGAYFGGDSVDFLNAAVGTDLHCNDAMFRASASFHALKCGQHALFSNTQFLGEETTFSHASIVGDLVCTEGKFAGEVSFYSTKCNLLNCDRAEFRGKASFNTIKCNDHCRFNGSRFISEEKVFFTFAHIGGALLLTEDAHFTGPVSFEAARVVQGLVLSTATFERDVSLYGARIGRLIMDDSFPFQPKSLDLRRCTFEVFEGPEEVATAFAQAQDPSWPDPVFCTRCYESVSTDSSSSDFSVSFTFVSRSAASANSAGVR